MSRGNIVVVSREVWQQQDGRVIRRKDYRVGLCVLDQSVAQILGGQLLCLLTQRSLKMKQSGTWGKLRPLEFVCLSKTNNNPEEEMQIVRPYQMFPSFAGEFNEHVIGRMTANWHAPLLHMLGVMTTHESSMRRELPMYPRESDFGLHPEVKRLQTGDLVAINGRAALVLSNMKTHAHHPYGPMLVAPLFPGASGFDDDGLTTRVFGARVGWEWFHAVQPCVHDQLELLRNPSNSMRETALWARSMILRLTGGLAATPGDALSRYLETSRQELIQRKLTLPIISAQVAPPELDADVIRFQGSSPGPLTGRMLSGPAWSGSGAEMGGGEYLHLEQKSEFVDVCLRRSGGKVELLLELVDDDAEFFTAWFEGSEGQVTGHATLDDPTQSRVISFELGYFSLDRPVDIKVFISTSVGSEELLIQHAWTSTL